ncbi:ketoacyl-synthetase C-terminal extension domain-containing protein, partial [Paenibacillus sp. GbtcB18]|uniref:ketoacyl-synthetase C-terminal extension domain-containing protein n=1 Tax=Paenibacillus sp. GbtcB18 TaxID=2824763 RepID=UPI002671A6DA
LVSLISLVQALRYETIPASLHCETENSYISWKDSPFYVNKANKPWQEKREKRRVGAINSFGMSGTNAHMVVKSYPSREREMEEETVPSYLIALSAKTEKGLQEKINELREMVTAGEITTKDLAGISYTLLEGRQHFQYRFAAIVQ